MKILVLNCGSSSVKFQLIEGEEALAKGLVEKIGSTGAMLRYLHGHEKEIREVTEVPDHETAVNLVLSTLTHVRDGVISSLDEIDGVGHRVVHGGEEFAESVLITGEVQAAIERCCAFAPLHNPHNIKGIEVCDQLLPGTPQVAVFDTAFHQKMPPENFLYGIPYGLYRKLGIRRYGFHGTSHRFVTDTAAEIIGKPISELRLISCHLGNGASIAAVKNGESIDTTMGFTPLEGLMMGTRSGDIDPAVLPYLIKREQISAAEVDSLLNKRSGLLGISETSNDMREIVEAMDDGDERNRLAFSMFCHRVKKYIGAYAAILGGVDAVIFTGGIGENATAVREQSLSGLEFLGINIDKKANASGEADISTGATRVMIIPTNEELAIARDTSAVLEHAAKADDGPSDEAIEEELLQLSVDDHRELILLWASDPNGDLGRLCNRLAHKLQKNISVQAVTKQLTKVGLLTIDEPAGKTE